MKPPPKMVTVTAAQIAAIRGTSKHDVYMQHFEKQKDRTYEVTDEIREYILKHYRHEMKSEVARLHREAKAEGRDSADIEELTIKKLREDIRHKKKQSRKLDLQHETSKHGLIAGPLVLAWMGSFASGLRTNLLSLGERIARGDIDLRDRIEKDVEKCIKKTLVFAAKETKKESLSISKAIMLQVETNENDH